MIMPQPPSVDVHSCTSTDAPELEVESGFVTVRVLAVPFPGAGDDALQGWVAWGPAKLSLDPGRRGEPGATCRRAYVPADTVDKNSSDL